MVSYLGIEALAQASEETRIAGRTIPRAIILTLVTVIVLYMFISFVGVNVIPPVLLSTTWQNDPLTGVANNIPGIGSIGAAWIAILGCSISVIGANAGLIGSSRTLYALSKYQLLPSKFAKTHAKFRTPHLAILVFGTSSIILVGVAAFDFFNGGEGPLTLLGSLYNVGALVAYVSAHASLIVTRNRDKLRFRPFRVPFSIRFGQGDRQRELPILPLLGLIGTGAIWIAVIATHALGRILGLVWVIVGLSIYAYYRKSRNLPVWKNMRQDYD
jgi:APA family basic amino acid/polyamine antiporter